MDTLRLLLIRLQCFKPAQKTGGFTLIELLIAMILATLVITPLLGFMLNIIETEGKEQAKTTSDQEAQSALNYIAQDLKQAVYIYDAEGLDKTSNDNPPGIKNQIPPVAEAPGCGSTTTTFTCVPVLVFWKREFKQDALTREDDTFVYSLVAYYLIKGNNVSEARSNAARIGRFQITDGVTSVNTPTNTDGSINYIDEPSQGFQLFNLKLAGVNFQDKMNSWLKTNENYTDKIDTLVDFIDTNNMTPNCPADTQQVPSTLAGGFYACIDSSRTLAQIHIRGNALARIRNDASCDSQSSYCPTATTQIQGRGLLNAD